MLEFYWVCFIVGVCLSVLTVVFGDLFDGALDGTLNFLHHGFLHPILMVSAVTVFGASGLMLLMYTQQTSLIVLLLSIIIAIGVSALLYLTHIKPSKKMENSTAYSMNSLVGMRGTVITSIPEVGCGEVLITIGASNVNQPAISFYGTEIPFGSKIKVTKVIDNVLHVIKI